MTTKKTSRRALFTSVMALVMCLVMLVGTTFAWFTDSVTSGVNTIKSGNLDVELEYEVSKGTFEKVTGETNVFKTGTLWEPGHVEYAVLKISNVGSLALKYQLGVKVAEEVTSKSVLGNELKLSNYLKFAVLNGDQCDLDRDTMVETAETSDAQQLSTGYAVEESMNAGAEAKLVTLVVWMPTTVGNEANYAKGEAEPTITLGINLVAKQDTVEKDSFDNKYDENASYGDVALVTPGTQEDLNNAIKNPTNTAGESVKDVRVTLPANSTLTLDSGIAHEGNKSRNVTFVGDGTQTVDVATNAPASEGAEHLNYQRGSTFTFENVVVENGTGTYDGIVCDELIYKNCTIKGVTTLYGKATFINCVFENTMPNQYSIWTWGGTDVTFEGCTFNTNGKAILLYGRATAANPTNLTVNSCEFNDRNNGTAGKAAIEIGNDYNATYNLVVNNTAVNGFADGMNTGTNLWGNKNSMDADHLSVTIDGTKVQ